MHAAHCQQAAGGPVRETALAPPQTGMWYLRQPYWPCERATAPMERRNRITSLPFHAGGGEEETTHRSRRAVWCGPSLHATCAACCPGRSPAGHRAGAPGTTRTVAEGSRTDSKRGRQRQPPRASARVSPAQGHACGHHPACIAETLPRTRIAHGHRSRDACLVEKKRPGVDPAKMVVGLLEHRPGERNWNPPPHPLLHSPRLGSNAPVVDPFMCPAVVTFAGRAQIRGDRGPTAACSSRSSNATWTCCEQREPRAVEVPRGQLAVERARRVRATLATKENQREDQKQGAHPRGPSERPSRAPLVSWRHSELRATLSRGVRRPP